MSEPEPEVAAEEIAFDEWMDEITPDATTLSVEETPDPRESAAPVDTYVPRPRREAEEAPPEI